MIFSSISFLFFFLPLFFCFYYLVPKKFQNFILLLFSLIFYFWGEQEYILLLLFSCFMNYMFGRLIEKSNKKIFLIIGIILNVGLLFYFKYFNFFAQTMANIFHFSYNSFKIILPLGISFFTFQNISYLIDVYKKEVVSEAKLHNYMLYITLFPQLIAGPIVRYKDIYHQILHRKGNLTLFSSGITKFIIGLGKKVLIADLLYSMITMMMSSEPTMLSYWLIALMFTFQIYYDFSGYSDMAIGLGRMIGFQIPENFNYPLTSFSITEFWRRWHISLSSFFKDYIYIPLGGSRCSKLINIRNILIVWLLTGLWHGANWNFILWGIYFFILLILEKWILKKSLKSNIFSYISTFLFIVISFVIFNISDLNELLVFLKGMLGIDTKLINHEAIYYFKNSLILLLFSFIGMGPWLKNRKEKLNKEYLEIIYLGIVFLLSIAAILSSSFQPFIYFRF